MDLLNTMLTKISDNFSNLKMYIVNIFTKTIQFQLLKVGFSLVQLQLQSAYKAKFAVFGCDCIILERFGGGIGPMWMCVM